MVASQNYVCLSSEERAAVVWIGTVANRIAEAPDVTQIFFGDLVEDRLEGREVAMDV
jgi:hypothetical protein